MAAGMQDSLVMIILSNGHSKFILGPAAAEAHQHGLLAGLITGGYPTASIRGWIARLRLDRFAAIGRLLQRQELLADALVYPLWASELVVQLSRAVKRITGKAAYSEWLEDYGLRLYAWQAKRIVGSLVGTVYHYRSGYGHQSVRIAKKKGMVTLCDHSIVHPAALTYLVSHGGRLPPPGQAGPVNTLWSNVLKDINQADYVLVNSEFVKETFLHYGYDPNRIFVLCCGIDEQFLRLIPQRTYYSPGAPVRLLFAGELGARKGGEVLLRALSRIHDLPWQFETIGPIDPTLRDTFHSFFADPRVTITDFLPWTELAQRMSEADIFVFPSLAEGSARVIFMAMACGCYVITTPNSGSVVRDGTHGRLVPPGDADKLELALRESLQTPEMLPIIGRRNANLVQNQYTQRNYGKGLIALYQTLLKQSVHQ